MSELLEYLVRNLVEAPDAVSVRQLDDDRALVFEVRVDESDLGRVIGKQGRIANAIRTIVNASAVKSRKRVAIEFTS